MPSPQQIRVIVVAVALLGLMALGVVLSTGPLRAGLFVLLSACGIALSAAVWPEILVMAYLFAGRYGFEARLAPFDLPISLNQFMLVGLAVVAAVNMRSLLAVLKTWTIPTLLFFSVVTVLGLGWSLGLNYGLYKVSRTWLVIVPGVLIAASLIQRRKSLIPLIAAAFLIGFALETVALLNMQASLAMGGGRRLTSLGSGPNIFSRTVGLSLLISLLSMLWVFQRGGRGNKDRLVILAGTFSVLVLLPGFLMAQSRGPVLALIVAFGLVLTLSLYGNWRALLGGLGLLGALGGVTSWLLAALVGESRFDLTKKSNQVSVDVRVDHLWDTWDLILQYPLLGVGTGGWPVQVLGIDFRYYPHNFFAEVASENGIPLALMLLTVFAVVFGRGVVAWMRATDPAARFVLLGALAAFLFFLINVSVTGDTVDNRLIWLTLIGVELAARFAASPTTRSWVPPPVGPASHAPSSTAPRSLLD